MDVEVEFEGVTEAHKSLGMRLTTLNYLLEGSLTQEQLDQFLLEHPYTSLRAAIQDVC